jgi:hypothetical protein
MNPSSLSDRELLTATRRIADQERDATASLVSLLAEVDSRRLYLGEGHSSLFTYCTRVLRLSESAAYARITAARAARRFPAILVLLKEGAISLTTVSLLATHLSEGNSSWLKCCPLRPRHRWRRGRARVGRPRVDRPPVAYQPPYVAQSGPATTDGAPLLEPTVDAVRPASSSSITSSHSQLVDQARWTTCSFGVARTMPTKRRGSLASGG